MLAKLLDRRILEVGFYPIDLAGRKIDAAHVTAVIFTIYVFVRMRLFPRAFRCGCNIMIAVGGVVIRNKPAAQLADHLAFLIFTAANRPLPAWGIVDVLT